MVITSGREVDSREIELEIDALAGVKESAVIGVPHPDVGEALVAVLVMEIGSALTDNEIQAALKARIAEFKCPKVLFRVLSLPRNALGKVQKNLLREQFAETFADI